MMAKYIKYIFAYLFSAYFLLAGMGCNVISYCCQSCANKGVELLETNSCSTIHNHTKPSPEHEDAVCSNLNHHPENCHLLRLSTDTPSFQIAFKLYVKQIQLPDLFIATNLFFKPQNELLVQRANSPPRITLAKTGRKILALNATFLI